MLYMLSMYIYFLKNQCFAEHTVENDFSLAIDFHGLYFHLV